MSAADGFLTPPPRSLGAAHVELEQRYRRLLRLYPREFRARREAEMLGVLMATAADGQREPARGDAGDIVRGALLVRLRGPRGGWAPAMSAFALLAPVFLVLTDILQVTFPYWEPVAGWQRRVRNFEAIPASSFSGGVIPAGLPVREHIGGVQLLSSPGFLILVAGHVLIVALVFAGWRRTALAAIVLVTVAYVAAAFSGLKVLLPGASFSWTALLVTAFATITVFLLEAIALLGADPRAARRRETWQHAITLLVLAAGIQAWVLAFDAQSYSFEGASGTVATVIGFVFAAVALLLPLAIGLGWRSSLLLAALWGPFAQVELVMFVTGSPAHSLASAISANMQSAVGGVQSLLITLFLPSLLIVCWGAAKTLLAARSRRREDLTA